MARSIANTEYQSFPFSATPPEFSRGLKVSSQQVNNSITQQVNHPSPPPPGGDSHIPPFPPPSNERKSFSSKYSRGGHFRLPAGMLHVGGEKIAQNLFTTPPT